MASELNAEEIAKLSLHDTKRPHVQLSDTAHRIALSEKWSIPKGSKVLEIGCGQGDCTAVLAELVGPDGHVTALDPAELTYGFPYTLGEAQAHLSKGRLGDRITWKQADPLTFLEDGTEQYDFAVFAHCLWYFSSPTEVHNALRRAGLRAKRVCIAEWSLSSDSAETHILAALAQAALECRKPESVSNVRTVTSPARLKEIAAAAGLALENEGTFTPDRSLLHGKWETSAVLDEHFVTEVNEFVKNEREKSMVLAFRDAVAASVKRVEGLSNVRSMDTWWATLEPKQ